MSRFRLNSIAISAGLVLFGPPTLAASPAPASNMPVQVKTTNDGSVLVTPAGMTLYAVSNEDTKAEKFIWQCTNIPPTVMNDQQSGVGERPVLGSRFIKSCTQKYPPYLADASARAMGDFTIVDRPGIGRQWMYRNYPLYTSIKDFKPGDRNGAGGGGLGGGGQGGGWRYATLAQDLPAGLKFARVEDGLILSNFDNRPIYTPQVKGAQLASFRTKDFKPLRAPGMALVGGDWSVIEVDGLRQYAFRGKPLYAAPDGMSEYEISTSDTWRPVLVQKAPAVPAGIKKQITLTGEVYTNMAGRTLYLYACNAGSGAGGPRIMAVPCDDAGDPAAYMVALCGDAKTCAARWHPYIAPANARPIGDWSVIDITYPMFTEPHGTLYPSGAPRVKAWAYRGKPVFTYYEDLKPGDIWGDGTKGLWGSNFSALVVPGHSAAFE